ncbi:ATP-binding protein [Vibrio sp. 947]|uniref:ATP-binding protein n=1 Tax=unclassified Vibrio TaxID=2614977 RepID=UPI002964C030|nr:MULTISPECIES: ATP-binding protein [unclassified Vibrio]MDW1584501.1 ATP-binding protein [Vibrio sp. Vb2897]MDW1642759.1 ATP-binding protein [Vibrio sp. Vb2896]MDW1928071.1 ATP-binding protein [Vibrio sp. 947]
MKKGLRKIILINSYMKELVSEVEIGNNTMITGDNGAGKTSFLKLIPAFFGMKTSKISKKSENTDNFVQFYLPYKNSYIVYEYVTHLGNVAQVVLSRHHTTSIEPKVQYRFVAKPFDASDYLNEEQEGKFIALEPHELHTLWSERLINFTKAVPTQSDFRKVMQNDELRTVEKDFHPYSLTGGRNNLKHIDYIVHALITGKVSIPDIKSLLAKIMHQSGGDYKLQFNPNEAERWIEHYEVVSKFESKKEPYMTTLENGNELIENEDQLEVQAKYIESALQVITEQFVELQQSVQGKKSVLKEAENAKNQLIETSSESLSNLKGRISGASTQIDKINRQQDHFIDQEIEHKLALFESIPEKEADVATLQSDLDYYSSHSKDIEQINTESELRVKEKNADIKREQKAKESALKAIDGEHEIAKSSLEQNHSKLISQIEKQYSQEREISIGEKHKVEAEISSLSNAILSVPLDEEVVAIAAEISKTHTREVELLNESGSLSSQKYSIQNSDLLSEKNTITSQLKEFLNEKNAHLKSIETLDELKNGLKGSALNAIRAIDPELINNPIIKVLGHKLLLRTDLSAHIDEIDIDAGIYGLHLDIDSLQSPSEFEDMDNQIIILDEKIAEIDEKTEAIRQRLKEIDAKIATNNVELKRLDKKLDEVRTLIDENKSKREFLSDKKASLIAEKEASLIKRKEAAEKMLRKAERNIAAITEKRDESIEELNASHLTAKSDCDTMFSEKREASEDIFEQRIDRLKKDIKAIREDANARINDIDFDNEAYRAVKASYDKLIETIEEYRSYEPLINSYTKFKEDDLTRLDDLIAEKQSLLQEQSLLTQKVEIAKQDYARKKADIETEVSALNRKIDALTELKSNLTSLSSSLSDMGIETVHDAELPNDFDISDFVATNQKLVSKTIAMGKSVKRELSSIQQELVSNGSEDIRKCWNDEVGMMTTSNSHRLYRAQIVAFNKIVHEIIPGFKQIVISNALAMGHGVNEFKLQLNGISRTINDLGRKISDAVNGCSNYDSITDISINLESVIHKIHGWESIVDFCDAYTSWQESDYKENILPGETFKNRLKQIIDIKRIGNSDVKIEDLFNVVFAVTENGRRKTARTATDLEKMSSNGLTFLFISTLYLGMIKVQRGASLVSIQWPVDELGKLSTENTLRLIGILENNNIAIATALPEPNIDLMNSFGKMYHISKHGYLVENNVEKDELALMMENA